MIDPFLVGLDRRMNVVIGEVEQEGFLFVSFLEKSMDSSVKLDQVLAFLFRLQSRVGPRGVVAAGGALVVTSDVEVEPLVGRPVPFIPKVPLPCKRFGSHGSSIPRRWSPPHELGCSGRWDGVACWFSVRLSGYPVGDVHSYRMASRHDAGPGGGADPDRRRIRC